MSALFSARADEGMWIPMLIGKNYDEMQRMGLKLTAEDLYSANHSSLKDAIVHFGGGCTGEIISPNGLLITNHHCGYGSIAELSTVENNYLENGFWAKSFDEEIAAPGLSVKFLVRMEDVTNQMLKAGENSPSEEKKKKAMDKVKEELEKKANENGRYSASVTSYFNGNQYILLVYQVFNDVRMVGTPPKSLGKYGGDTDNWMWPRHTADFSMFRVYADKNNNPAPYSKANVPYKPKQFLPVSTQGVKENDFAMVMGYPGRTNRYETSYGVDMAINEVNPSIVKIRDMRLGIMRNYMRKDPAVNLKLASSYARIANYWKYFIGQTEQLKRLRVIDEKQRQEQDFTSWAKATNRDYEDLMNQYARAYTEYRPYAKHNVYYTECFMGSGLARLAAKTNKLHQLLSDRKTKAEEIGKEVAELRKARKEVMKDFVPAAEQEMLARTAELFYKDVPHGQQPDFYQRFIFKQFGNSDWTKTFNDFANYAFLNTFLLDEVKFENFCSDPSLEKLDADPAVQYALSFVNNYEQNYKPRQEQFGKTKESLSQQYIKGLMQKNQGKLFYPDANSTMRITYGTVGGYHPQDAVTYDYYTTIDGLLDKYKPGDEEFDLPQNFLDLCKTKEYGRYANANGELVTCFITNNDITGGNSGSPVINGSGELLGLAFDGNWEAMSGDIAFDKKYKRTIVVDIRFVLWLIDKYGGANNLIGEMKLN
ncbi:S46 family peptidase [Taibaiella koreensis]|uniref:S46 family peptidase n=1 Tax=Taibaiella koreensis TaxID=1268548 RepID=UPI001969271E|nr:S46 family peptidase [Taibaiella koreensis]